MVIDPCLEDRALMIRRNQIRRLYLLQWFLESTVSLRTFLKISRENSQMRIWNKVKWKLAILVHRWKQANFKSDHNKKWRNQKGTKVLEDQLRSSIKSIIAKWSKRPNEQSKYLNLGKASSQQNEKSCFRMQVFLKANSKLLSTTLHQRNTCQNLNFIIIL